MADEPIDRQALAAFIRERKPPYMVPAAIIQLDAIPRNQNGKLDRRVLPKPEVYVTETPYVAPRNETEAALARGFAVALGIEKASAEEDFFAAGGDSLSLVRLLAECRDLKLNYHLVYEGKTPIGIANLLAQQEAQEQNRVVHRDTHCRSCTMSGATIWKKATACTATPMYIWRRKRIWNVWRLPSKRRCWPIPPWMPG